MNLLIDPFISTTNGRITLKQALTTHSNATLQYVYDETQLAVLQLLSSLATAALQPTLAELKEYISNGVTENLYDEALQKIDISMFDDNCFMRSSPSTIQDYAFAGISKLVSGIESGTSNNACALFSDAGSVVNACPSCMPALNYNLHMNIKGECFAATGATGIRGGGALTTLISGKNLAETILCNCIAKDFFKSIHHSEKVINEPMWVTPIAGETYFAHQIGLVRGLFALAYHIQYTEIEEPCVCDVCGHTSDKTVKEFGRIKYQGKYASTKAGRDSNAGLWPHPYTPTVRRETGEYFESPQGANWQSWENLGGYVVGKELEKSKSIPAPILDQSRQLNIPKNINILVGGNIADQGSIVGRVYDLYSVPQNWNASLERVTLVIDSGLEVKEILKKALNKIHATTYDKALLNGIRDQVIGMYVSQAQQIVQSLLVESGVSERKQLRQRAITALKQKAQTIYSDLIRRHQHDIPIFEALIKGQKILNTISE
ncbi:type I-E CRISPR-associated protein Cse1/CasA [Saccharophagus degradans]|uniref:Type I-E CRISPR-associated protein Cse1/CasA n=1 Tax=Saccharophagus degradans TaxID=86304 RepID=A0AAW7X5F9_9GAMM|nr:type I-E CRISPR-associated protein Cse1/CasA [Saccharophagus degradans]MDO6422770.1 type I-E CRISPR-associated protein Cse1/CasA [Saccharophagus degradans]MDO6606243.1 type I-E CRISPR-associated protein Cse1/CasA [Saccharophagus degradans]